jgi:hypothetical protein
VGQHLGGGASGAANTFTLTVDGRVVKTRTIAGVHVTFDWNTAGWANGPQTLFATVTDATGKSGLASRTIHVGN